MITYFQSIILGAVQGITELFPVSSLGHSVILPKLLEWNINQQDPAFLTFLVATHLATALVLLAFFSHDWVLIIKGIFRSLLNRRINREDVYEKLGWLIVIASIPVGILGVLFQNKIAVLFASPTVAAIFLVLNGLMLWKIELMKKNGLAKRQISEASSPDGTISKLSWTQSIKVGCLQVVSLLPGFSRTGSALTGGLLVGLDHEAAARFSFLLATPIILAAALLKLPSLFSTQSYAFGPTLAGAIVAAIGAYLSVKFLSNYFKTKTLIPFAIYCILAGLGSLAVFFFR